MDTQEAQARWEMHDLIKAVAIRQALAERGFYPQVAAGDFPLHNPSTAETARDELRALIEVLDLADLVALWELARLLYADAADPVTYGAIETWQSPDWPARPL